MDLQFNLINIRLIKAFIIKALFLHQTITCVCVFVLFTPFSVPLTNKMQVYNVEIETDYSNNSMLVTKVNGENAFVKIFKPGQEINDEILNRYHQFPGIATSILFPQLHLHRNVQLLTSDHRLHDAELESVCFNFHVCNKRFVFGTLPAVIVDKRFVNLYVGAPIFFNEKIVSIVTTLHEISNDRWLVPVTGIREASLFSGHVKTNNGVRLEKWLPNTSIYGTKQLPYAEIKQYALEQEKTVIADAEKSCVIFYKESEIRITWNQGEHELMHIRMTGPFVESNFS